MAQFEIVMPKMGESIIEATITKWLKDVGDSIEEDDSICELATDKVDSEIPSPVDGKLVKRLYDEGEVVEVGKVIAIIEMEGDDDVEENSQPDVVKEEVSNELAVKQEPKESGNTDFTKSDRFYSPLVKNIAKTEKISVAELDSIEGSGKDGRVTKVDVLNYLENRNSGKIKESSVQSVKPEPKKIEQPIVTTNTGDEIVEMDRMRKLIADHMVMSKQVSPHVTSFIDVDMTNVVLWRNKVKNQFQEREGEKLTFTPIFFVAAAKALREFPMVNASVNGSQIILRKRVNIGMATALPNGNLIVPVIKDTDHKNIVGLAKSVNDLANRARNNKLDPDEISGGTFTITNFGSFQSTTGTPIINQPQVAIMGVGAIQKKPVVLETEMGDVIGIRHMMILSLAYDHRIVDGALGGMFIKKVKEILENWDVNQGF